MNILYGVGQFYEIHKNEILDKYKVDYVIDKKLSKIEFIDGIKVKSYDFISELTEANNILVSVSREEKYNNIHEELSYITRAHIYWLGNNINQTIVLSHIDFDGCKESVIGTKYDMF